MSGSVSGGKQKQNESGSFNNQNAFDTSVSSSGTINPIAPDGFTDFWSQINPGQGTSGVNAAQGYFADRMNPGGSGSSYTLATLADNWGDQYSDFTPITAPEVAAQRGSEFMGDYENKYLGDVLDSSLADYDYGVGGAANAFRLGDLGSGGGGSRSTVAAAEMAGQAARGRGALTSGIRSNAFNTAANLGMQDANRFLSAGQTNAANALQTGMFNNQMQNQREMFDVNAAYQGDAMRDAAANAMGNFSNLGFNQGLGWLGAGNPLFGQQNTSQTDTSGTSTSSGTNQGSASGSSKGGGIGFG